MGNAQGRGGHLKQDDQQNPPTNTNTNTNPGDNFSTRSFTFLELATATNNFRNPIGKQGRLGPIYKGELPSGEAIAVRLLGWEGGSLTDEEREKFLMVVLRLTSLRHPNLHPLLGYCIQGDQRVLVNQYMPNHSLEFHLYKGRSGTLRWDRRMRIARGVAKALNYLHDSQPPIIYKAMKSRNILLDTNFNPRLADFGLARYRGPHLEVYDVDKTLGYCAPEYDYNAPYTVKGDVYAFGILLLELISGNEPWDMIVSWGKNLFVEMGERLENNDQLLLLIADHQMQRDFSVVSLRIAFKLVLRCVQDDPELRPSMACVVRTLDNLITLIDPNCLVLPVINRRVREELADRPLTRSSFVWPKRGSEGWPLGLFRRPDDKGKGKGKAVMTKPNKVPKRGKIDRGESSSSVVPRGTSTDPVIRTFREILAHRMSSVSEIEVETGYEYEYDENATVEENFREMLRVTRLINLRRLLETKESVEDLTTRRREGGTRLTRSQPLESGAESRKHIRSRSV